MRDTDYTFHINDDNTSLQNMNINTDILITDDISDNKNIQIMALGFCVVINNGFKVEGATGRGKNHYNLRETAGFHHNHLVRQKEAGER